jgi:hypothetical protein
VTALATADALISSPSPSPYRLPPLIVSLSSLSLSFSLSLSACYGWLYGDWLPLVVYRIPPIFTLHPTTRPSDPALLAIATVRLSINHSRDPDSR